MTSPIRPPARRRGSRALRTLIAAAALVLACEPTPSAPADPQWSTDPVIPLEGALSANVLERAEGEPVILYFAVTPLVDTPLDLRMVLPEEIVPVEGQTLVKELEQATALDTIHLTVRAMVNSSNSIHVKASATIGRSERLILSRDFELYLNGPPPATSTPSSRQGVGGSGTPLIIYESVTPPSPKEP